MRSERVAFYSQHFVPVDGAGDDFSNICTRSQQFCECVGAFDTQLCHVTCDFYTLLSENMRCRFCAMTATAKCVGRDDRCKIKMFTVQL